MCHEPSSPCPSPGQQLQGFSASGGPSFLVQEKQIGNVIILIREKERQGFIDLLKKTKTTFCGVYTFSGRYKSKSGYETHVQLRSDMDGDFKVSFIERKFSSPSLDSLLLLEKELKQRYAAYIPASLVNADRDKERFLLLPLQLRHPVMLRSVGLRSDAQDLRVAFWQMGWMDFKGRELEIKNVMRAISERKKKEIPMCKPEALSVD